MQALAERIKKIGLKIKNQATQQVALEVFMEQLINELITKQTSKRPFKNCFLKNRRVIVEVNNKSLANELFLQRTTVLLHLKKHFGVDEVVFR